MADYQESPGAGLGQRPPQRNRKPEVCVPLLILLMIFAWPVGMFYLFYRLFINPEMARGLEEVVGWVESLFQGKPKARRTGGFHKPQPKTGPIPFHSGQKAQTQAPYHHRCTVCGRTDVSNPELEFRYCSKCNGYYCYCEDHINNHTHIE